MNVLVVGAGVVGYAVAYELAARGARVQVVDSRGSGQGATRASAGMLAPYIEGHSSTLLQLGVRSLDQYDSFIARLSAGAGRPIEYRRTGTLQVALSDAGAARLEEQAQGLSTSGIAHSMLSGPEVLRLEPALAPGANAGLVVPQHGYVGVASLMLALVEAAARRGAEFKTAQVRAVEPHRGLMRVETSGAALTADAVILAAGSWSASIAVAPGPSAPVRPVRGQLLQLSLGTPPLRHVVWGPDCYLVPWQDGNVLVGATAEDVGFDESVTADGVRQLLERGLRVVPALASARFVEARAGLRPATADELPVIGPSSTMRGVFYATGHYRNGVLLAPLTAAMLADLVLEGRERRELDLVRPDRFGL